MHFLPEGVRAVSRRESREVQHIHGWRVAQEVPLGRGKGKAKAQGKNINLYSQELPENSWKRPHESFCEAGGAQ